jgi:hypothetical protein
VGGRLGTTVTALAPLALVGYLCVAHGADVARAVVAVPPWAIAAAVALHLATLVLRSEAWRLTLLSAGATALPRRAIHAANATAFVAGAAQSQAALPARVTLLRRLAGDAAPRPAQLYVADVPIFGLELCATALLLAAAVAAGRGAWWVAPGAVAVAFGVLAAARAAPRRFAHHPLARGLAVLGDRTRRGRLVALVATVVALTLARIWVVLEVCDLPHGLGEIAWVFAAMGVFGLLPVGPGASPGATLATLAASSLGGAAAAGLLLAASSVVAVLVYALAVAVRLRAPVQRRPVPRAGRRVARSPA